MASSLISLADKSFCLSEKSLYKKLEQTAVTKREKVNIEPITGTGNYLQNQKIIFKFPSTGFIDPTTLRFAFTATTSATVASVGFANGCSDLFRRVRILAGSTEIIDIDHYNTWVAFNQKAVFNWMNQVTQGDLFEAFNIQGYATSCQFGGPARGLISGEFDVLSRREQPNFQHQFQAGIFQVLQYIPLSLINDLQLEIYLETNANAIYVSPLTTPPLPTNVTYTVSNCKLYYDLITFTPEFASTMLKVIETEGALYIPFYQVRCQERTLVGGQDNATFQINEKVSSLNQVFVIPIAQSRINNETQNGIGSFNPLCYWVNHQFKLNQTYFPSYVIENFTEWMTQNAIACNQYNVPESGGLINRINASTVSCPRQAGSPSDPGVTNQFMCEFYAFDFEREKCPDLSSGIDTRSGSSELEFIIRYDNADTGNFFGGVKSNKLMLFYVMFDSILQITAGGITTCLR